MLKNFWLMLIEKRNNKLRIKKELWLPLLVLIIGLIVLMEISIHIENSQRDLLWSKAKLNAVTYADRMKSDIIRGIDITNTFEQIIISDNGKTTMFSKIAENMMADFIQSIQIAPDGVVTEIYPEAGNEAGKIDLIHDKDRGRISCYARDNDVITMQGPFPLKQGGTGIAVRNPVYIEQEDGEKTFWGFTIVIIRVPDIFADSIKSLSNFDYEYKLSKNIAPWDDTYEEVYGSGVEMIAPATYTFELGDSQWKLEVMPNNGWTSSENLQVLFSCGILIVLLLTVFVFVLILLQRTRESENKALELNKKLQSALEQAKEASAAKSNFLFNISHDIRTPMNAILGFVELAEKNPKDSRLITEYLDKIRISGKGMLLILDKVLEISRIESGKVMLEESPQKCEAVLNSCITMMSPEIEKKHLIVTVEEKIHDPYIYFDEARITEIILNILSNAIKYTADGGKIHCTVRQFSHPDKGWIYQEVSVADNGIGMSEEFQEHIFELFAREKSSTVSGVAGTGLGMGIVKKLVDLMNGRIQIDSEQGKGTTVTFRVPLRLATFEDTQPKYSSMNADKEQLCGKHILLAEDNDINAEIAISLLEEEGLILDRAVDGVQCVEKLERAQNGHYALILMDVQMPNLDGYQATEKIRKLNDKEKANIPIIAMTANAFSEDKAKALEVGMNDHVAKPINMDVLVATILKYI